MKIVVFQDFQGFFNDLQDWERSLKDKDKKMKQQPSTSSNLVRSFLSSESLCHLKKKSFLRFLAFETFLEQ